MALLDGRQLPAGQVSDAFLDEADEGLRGPTASASARQQPDAGEAREARRRGRSRPERRAQRPAVQLLAERRRRPRALEPQAERALGRRPRRFCPPSQASTARASSIRPGGAPYSTARSGRGPRARKETPASSPAAGTAVQGKPPRAPPAMQRGSDRSSPNASVLCSDRQRRFASASMIRGSAPSIHSPQKAPEPGPDAPDRQVHEVVGQTRPRTSGTTSPPRCHRSGPRKRGRARRPSSRTPPGARCTPRGEHSDARRAGLRSTPP